MWLVLYRYLFVLIHVRPQMTSMFVMVFWKVLLAFWVLIIKLFHPFIDHSALGTAQHFESSKFKHQCFEPWITENWNIAKLMYSSPEKWMHQKGFDLSRKKNGCTQEIWSQSVKISLLEDANCTNKHYCCCQRKSEFLIKLIFLLLCWDVNENFGQDICQSLPGLETSK